MKEKGINNIKQILTIKEGLKNKYECFPKNGKKRKDCQTL